MGITWPVAVVTLAALAGSLAWWLSRHQESLVYFPDTRVRFTPAELEMPFEEVRLVTADGVRLAAWWIPAPHSRAALVFCPGNAGNMGDRIAKFRLFHDLGVSVLAFDYRGYGASEGKPSEAGTASDMETAIAHVGTARGVPLGRTVFYGESLGGAVALAACAARPPAALVLESTFTSARGMARHHYRLVPPALVRVGYDSLSRIRSIACPVLILHGTADTVVPFAMGEALFRAAPEPKSFATLDGDHNDGGLVVSPAAHAALAAFIDALLPPPAAG